MKQFASCSTVGSDRPLAKFAAIATQARAWRHQIHECPELLFDLPQTSALVRERLQEFGCDQVVSGIAGSGIVATIVGRNSAGPSIALRADMDALPIDEQTNLPHASRIAGRMHACGHDGHTAMLLGAAAHLAANRDFSGRVVLIFQPAEEGGAGARAMIEDGLLDRFAIDAVYAMHNKPGLPVGAFATRSGPMLAAGDRFVVTFEGQGGHAAMPHLATDCVLAASNLVGALQSIASRFTDPFDPVVVSVTYVEGGKEAALNVIPARVRVGGSIRTINPATRAFVEKRFRQIVAACARQADCEAAIEWRPGYPVMVNHPAGVHTAASAARRVVGADMVDEHCPQLMGSEDFSYMLEHRPGALIWVGNGCSADLHSNAYDFNDDAIPYGIAFWVSLVEQELGVGKRRGAHQPRATEE
jgi:amidohydrolase